MKNYLLLGITQSRYSSRIFNWSNPSETKYGIDGYVNRIDYVRNYKLLYSKLFKILNKDVLVVTHNPWGEYGHPEHIQVNRVIYELSKIKNFEFFVTGFVSTSTLIYARYFINRLSNDHIKYKTNPELYNTIKKIYEKYNCWTWFQEPMQNKYELFYKQINNLQINKKSVTYVNQIPLYIINDGNNFSRNFFHFIKIFIPRFLKKILRELKFRNAK